MSDVMTYPVRLENKEGKVFVFFPDFPEAFTYGEDQSDALECASDCLREALSGRIRDNEEIPVPSPATSDTHTVTAPPSIAAKALVYRAFKSKKLSGRRLADILDLDEREVRRILDPQKHTRLDRLDQVGRALGVRLKVVATAV